jgi:pyruvate/2-oxoglutarate dehydrogenase complex dihydrolipoamide acyltransferase (E2) component
VAVIETDKVNVDIRSPLAGVITKYFANEGETVAVDAQFLEIDTDAKGGAAPEAKPKAKEEKSEEKKAEAAPRKEEAAPPKKEEKVIISYKLILL